MLTTLERLKKAYKNSTRDLSKNEYVKAGELAGIGAGSIGAGAAAGALTGLGAIPGAAISGSYTLYSALSAIRDEYKRLKEMGESKELNELVGQLIDEGYSDQDIEQFFEDIENLTEEQLQTLIEAPAEQPMLSRKIYMNPDMDQQQPQGNKKKGQVGITVNGPYRGSNDTFDYSKKNVNEAVGKTFKRAKKAYDNTYYSHSHRDEMWDQVDKAGMSAGLALGSMGAGGLLGAATHIAGGTPNAAESWAVAGLVSGAGLGAKAAYHAAKAAYYKGKMTKDYLSSMKKEYSRLKSIGESTEEIEEEIAIMEAVLEEGNDITSKILTDAITDSAANVQDTFEAAIKDRISHIIDQRKADLAQKMFSPVEEEVEQIDEISKDKLGRYINKASGDIGTLMMKSGRHDQIARDRKDKYDNYEPENDKIAQKNFDKAEKRLKGIGRAVDRIKDPVYGESERKR